jgi:hypothetical protein
LKTQTYEWTLAERVYLAIVDLMHTDARVHRAYTSRSHEQLLEYAEGIVKNPNQTQVAQRIYAHAIATRLEGK